NISTNIITFLGISRELHKKDYPILWDGHLACPCIISGQDARTTINFGIFFLIRELLNSQDDDL
ncbi:MAG: hypothetical protein ACKPER_19055, partial [Dolichospermum sp.]